MVFRVTVEMLSSANVHFRGHKQLLLIWSTLAVDINRPFRKKIFPLCLVLQRFAALSRLSLDTISLAHFVICSSCVNQFTFTLPVIVFLANTIKSEDALN